MRNEVSVIDDFVLEKGLPANTEAERSILGAILLNNDVCYQAIELLRREDFFLNNHRRIFDKMVALTEENSPIDLITLSDTLRRANEFENIGGATYIASLIDGVPRTDTIEHYAKIVKSKARLRKLIRASRDIAMSCYDEEDDPDVIIEKAEQKIFELSEGEAESNRARHVAIVSSELADFYEEKCSDRSRLIGLSTGYSDLDKRTSGLAPGVIVFAGRPGHCKTSSALNIACNVALAGGGVYFASLESSAEELCQRILASLSRVDSTRMREGRMERDEWNSLLATLGKLAATNFVIDDTVDNPESLLHRLRQFKVTNRLDLVVVDYLQLMADRLLSDEGRRFRDIRTAVRYVMVQLVKIRKALKVPVIALAQLGRGVDTRPDHRPMLSDLMESSSIEQNSDLILFLIREELYNRTDENKSILKIIFGKFKDGQVAGDLDMAFIEKYTRMESLSRD